jgi:predicted MFS family arabinose efflux permease
MFDETDRKISSFEQETILSKNIKYKNVKHLLVRLFILCLSTFYFGYSLTYLSSISLTQVFGSLAGNAAVQGILIGAISIGAAIGAFISPFLMKCLSRRLILYNTEILS